MNTGRAIGELDLLAYVDGLLEPRRRAEVEAYLAAHPEDAAWVRDCLEQNELIRELYDRPYHEPVPEPLSRRLDGRAARAASPLRRIAAALLLFVSGGVAGWWIGQSGPPPGADPGEAFVREMAAAHAAARTAATGPGIELATDVSLPALDRPATAGAGTSEAPDLSAHGLALVGQRLVRGPGDRPALQLTYRDLGGRLVSLYLRPDWPEGRDPEPRLTDRAGLAVARWPADPLVYGLVGDLPKEEVAAIARSVHGALRAGGGSVPAPVAASGTGGAGATLAPVVIPPAAPAVEGRSAGAAEM
ncbi:MAG TPA: hypothetical protein VFG47_19200 [Geminicoccaceae bacterium]|nr:hypothetical protein [Geminicoccaceae bacterium]